MEALKEMLNRIVRDLGYNPDPEIGRSADVNRRIAKILGTSVDPRSPKEEYAFYASMAKPINEKPKKRLRRVS